MERYDWFNTSGQSKRDWEKLCPEGEYAVVTGADLPSVIPEGLRGKAVRVLVMASGTADGSCYYMANMSRLDSSDNAIDQNPFGIAFIADSPTVSGVLVQHGNWDGRTSHPPQEFWDHVTASGVGNYLPISGIPSKTQGKLSELDQGSQTAAFEVIVNQIRKFTGEQDAIS